MISPESLRARSAACLDHAIGLPPHDRAELVRLALEFERQAEAAGAIRARADARAVSAGPADPGIRPVSGEAAIGHSGTREADAGARRLAGLAGVAPHTMSGGMTGPAPHPG